MATSEHEDGGKIGALLEDIDIAMLTTVGPQGFLVSRPLSTRMARFDGSRVWFFIEADSPKVAEIRRNAKVNLAYASDKRNTYVSLTGTARVVRDEAVIEALWTDASKAFFPKGKDDPNLALLEVELRSAEYWDGPSTLVGKLVSFVVARVTKNEEAMGENRIVDLQDGQRSRLPPSHARARKGAGPAAKRLVAKGTRAAAKKSAARAGASSTRSGASTSASTRGTAGNTEVASSRKSTVKKAPAKGTATGKTASKKSASGTAAAKTGAAKKTAKPSSTARNGRGEAQATKRAGAGRAAAKTSAAKRSDR